jgi:signal peptidase I
MLNSNSKRIIIIIIAIISIALIFLFLNKDEKKQEFNLSLEDIDYSCITEEDRTIKGLSMHHNFDNGEIVKVLNNFHECNNIEKGQIVMIGFKTRSEEFVRHLTAVPGDELIFKNNNANINGKTIKTKDNIPYEFSPYSQNLLKQSLIDNIIKKGNYLVLSDEPDQDAFDSRRFTYIETQHLKGLVIKNSITE